MQTTLTHYVFSITGLAGHSTESSITSTLAALDWISEISVDYDTRQVTICAEQNRMDAIELVQAFDAAGVSVSTEQIILPIRGMTCIACISRIEWGLADVPGALAIDVNLTNQRATITFISGTAETEDFKQAVVNCGYSVPEESEKQLSAAVPPSQTTGSSRRLRVFTHALLFVAGFSFIFIVGWGGAATLLGQVFKSYKDVIAQVGGAVVIVFGLSTLGWVKIPWLNFDTRPEWRSSSDKGWVSSTLMGVFFAAGWTPCIGTTLGAILTLGFSGANSTQAMVLSSGYALGLGLPFLLLGLGMEKAAGYLRRFFRYMRALQITSGLLLIAIGAMLLTKRLALIAIWAQRNGFFPDFPLGDAATPTYPIAVAAGLISFLSPCVLPLVPAYIGYLSGHALGREND